jgi:RNA polymerase-binding transcription factor DksA
MKTLSRPFSDDTLREGREKLLARNALLVDRVKRVREDLREAHAPTSIEHPDAATGHESDDVLLAIEKSAYGEIARIEAALNRMEDDTFGLCEECGREIEASRFVPDPCATHCMQCASNG